MGYTYDMCFSARKRAATPRSRMFVYGTDFDFSLCCQPGATGDPISLRAAKVDVPCVRMY